MQKTQLLLILILSSILFLNSERLIAGHQKKSKTPRVTKALSLDGAYEFVSLTTTLSKPEKSIEIMEASEWIGYWILVNGHFSFNFMKVERDSWHAGLPPGLFELECDSGAGSYKIEKSQIR